MDGSVGESQFSVGTFQPTSPEGVALSGRLSIADLGAEEGTEELGQEVAAANERGEGKTGVAEETRPPDDEVNKESHGQG